MNAESGQGVQAFRSAVEAGDADALLATLAPDVRFSSPAMGEAVLLRRFPA